MKLTLFIVLLLLTFAPAEAKRTKKRQPRPDINWISVCKTTSHIHSCQSYVLRKNSKFYQKHAKIGNRSLASVVIEKKKVLSKLSKLKKAVAVAKKNSYDYPNCSNYFSLKWSSNNHENSGKICFSALDKKSYYKKYAHLFYGL